MTVAQAPRPLLEGAAPERTLEQRLDALRLANEVRTARAQLKLQLAAAPSRSASIERAIDVLLDPPDWAHTMKVYDLLLACRKIGRTKADKIFRKAAVSPSKTLAGISSRQRTALLDVVHDLLLATS